jgi:beta-galactosidase
MEHSTSAVNWQPRNLAKRPGQLRRNSLQHVARGSDGALFFQWRASKAGAEKYHSAMLPHGGTRTRVWREVRELGADLGALGEVAGTRIDAQVAVVFDWQAWWATELDSHPSVDVRYLDQAHSLYKALWEAGVAVDFVHPEAALDGYRLAIVPTLYCVSDTGRQRLTEFVAAGGTAVVTYFSGIVDEHDHIRLGGYPGAYRDLLGVWVEEFQPLRENESVAVAGLRDGGTQATVWTEDVHLAGAESIATFADGPLPGVPAVTRHVPGGTAGGGTAWYVATRLDDDGVRALLRRVLDEAGVEPVVPTRPGVEVVRRTGPERSYVFVINHTEEQASVPVTGTELLTGTPVAGDLGVPAGAVRVVRETRRYPTSAEPTAGPGGGG